MVLVHLSEAEIRLVEEHGNARYEKRVKQGRVSRKDGSSCNAEQDILGAGAEFAVGKYYGWQANFEILQYGDDGYDFLIGERKIDVKWTSGVLPDGKPRSQVRLIVNPGDAPSDVYISVTGSHKKGYRILGWTTREALVELPKHNFGWGEKYAMPERFFNPPITLSAYLQRHGVR